MCNWLSIIDFKTDLEKQKLCQKKRFCAFNFKLLILNDAKQISEHLTVNYWLYAQKCNLLKIIDVKLYKKTAIMHKKILCIRLKITDFMQKNIFKVCKNCAFDFDWLYAKKNKYVHLTSNDWLHAKKKHD